MRSSQKKKQTYHERRVFRENEMIRHRKVAAVVLTTVIALNSVFAYADDNAVTVGCIPVEGEIDRRENRANQSAEGEFLIMFGGSADPSVMEEYCDQCEIEENGDVLFGRNWRKPNSGYKFGQRTTE